MVRNYEVLALIPARGGSKGIPRKNICNFSGYPLIAYSIAAGLQSNLVTRVIVSTDDDEIAATAKSLGAEVPFYRPENLAGDTTLDLPVFQHALNWLSKNENYNPDLIVQLRPTSPIRPKTLVDDAVTKMVENPQADSIRGVVQVGQNPYKMWKIDHNGQMQPLLNVPDVDEPYNSPRQILPTTYWQTGLIDVIKPNTILNKSSMSGDIILPILSDRKFAIDIDSPIDWNRNEGMVIELISEIVYPGQANRPWPSKVSLVVFDFDGVMTDNRVWVNESGIESVSANRSDGMGVKKLLEAGIKAVILSTEPNPVVAARAKKIGLPFFYDVTSKNDVLQKFLENVKISSDETVYVGNDINDLPCFPLVARSFAVADAHPEVLSKADQILTKCGGHGAVREICDMLIHRYC